MNALLRKALLGVCLAVSALSTAAPASDAEISQAIEAGQYEKAYTLLLPRAESGDARAQATVGEMYLKGQGVKQDFDQAEHWLRLGADQGNRDAQYNLGLLAAARHGMHPDPNYRSDPHASFDAKGNVIAYRFGDVGIAIPAGFVGPVSAAGTGARSIVFYKPLPSDASKSTILQVSAIRLNMPAGTPSREVLIEYSKRCAAQFLESLSRNKTSFDAAPAQEATIAGQPAAKVGYTGTSAEGVDQGFMYCFVIGNDVYAIRTATVGAGPSPDLQAATQAVDQAVRKPVKGKTK